MKRALLCCLLVFLCLTRISAQTNPNLDPFGRNRPQPVDTAAYIAYMESQQKFKTKLLPSLILPGLLIGTGVAVNFRSSWLYDKYDAKADIRKAFPFKTKVDDYLIFAPYAEFAALTLLKIRCKNDLINTSILIAKSEVLMIAMVFPLKYYTNQLRPDSSNTHSFPSGHTAEAFVAASIVHKEFRYLSPWYGIGAYAIATSVAAFRMINNKHWMSDVIAGAGIGILATHIAYATHQHKWGRKEICMVPLIDKRSKGLMLAMRF